MDSEQILNLISRVGSNAYNVLLIEDDVAKVIVTPQQGAKLQELLGADNVQFVDFSDMINNRIGITINVEKLQAAANEGKRTSRGKYQIDIKSAIHYQVDVSAGEDGEPPVNEVTSAWWSSDDSQGGITINGIERHVYSGRAEDYYDIESTEANPERTVYVIDLPTSEGDERVTSYGMTNLIRSVAKIRATIG